MGTYASRNEAQGPPLIRTDAGVVVGVVSQTYGLNGIPHAEGRDWSVDLLDPAKAIDDARRAREAGADVVVFHMHAGTEYDPEPNADQRYMANKVTASGEVDLVIGQHAHVVQPIEQVNGVWTVFGTGNLMASMPGGRPATHDGVVVEVAFTERADGRFEVSGVEWAPTLITEADEDPTGRPRVLVVPDALAVEGEALHPQLEASAARTRQLLARNAPEGLKERTAPIR